jgi:hypothetical protein
MGHAYVTHATCVGIRPKGASDWLIGKVIRGWCGGGNIGGVFGFFGGRGECDWKADW